MYNPFYKFFFTILLASVFLAACSDDTPTSPDPDEPTIVEIAADNEDFSILVDALVSTGVVSTLEQPGPFTVFAPTDDAFANLPDGLLESLSDEQIAEILTYHVLGLEVFSTDLEAQQAAPTLAEQDIFITVTGAVSVNNSAQVTNADVIASNGVIHVIDEVLIPDTFGTLVDNAMKRFDLSSLVDAVVATGLTDALTDPDAELTVFAPTNEAFAEIADVIDELTAEEITDILLYHVIDARVLSTELSGEQNVTTLNGEQITITVNADGVMINNAAKVTDADVNGTNGVIHIIDTVLIPE